MTTKAKAGTKAVIHRREDGDKYRLLRETLKHTGFWRHIDAVGRSRKIPRTELRIVIKPDLEIYDNIEVSTGTDPQLVEHLILQLHRRGYPRVTVVDGMGSAGLWLENRDVPVLADLVGYRYETDDGRPYDVVNLSEAVTECRFPAGSTLQGTSLGRRWVEADFRISFAKNKTHEEHYFALGLQNLMGVLPLRDKEYHYFHRLDPGEAVVDLMRYTPVHFSIIDAVTSNHGSDGAGTPNPLSTNTMIAGKSLLLTDWAAALKMGLDPYASPLNAAALRSVGLPPRYFIEGDLTPYPGWLNVPPLLADSTRKRNASPVVRQLVRPWFPSVNRELFPFKNSVDERINGFIDSYLKGTDGHPLVLLALVGLNYLASTLRHLGESYQILYDKDHVHRRQHSLGLELEKYSLSDYEAIVDYMESLARITEQTPPDRNGLRWRYIDQSVLFQFSRHLPIPVDAFISKVDISAAVRMMNDNIGGALVTVKTDSRKRITHQAERNIYLPQPNWMAFFGGKVIDVVKLEYVRYEKQRRRIFWRTVDSANQSALFDDGIVTFEGDENGATKITIVARQQFTLPLFWQIFNIDLFPRIKDALVSDAYTTFFSRTVTNYEAAYEGRDPATGREWDPFAGEPGTGKEKIPMEQFSDGFAKLMEVVEPLLNNISRGIKSTGDAEAEPVGSTFFTAAGSFFSDLMEAVKKDLGSVKAEHREEEQQ